MHDKNKDTVSPRTVFRTQSKKVYDGAFLQKYLTTFSC